MQTSPELTSETERGSPRDRATTAPPEMITRNVLGRVGRIRGALLETRSIAAGWARHTSQCLAALADTLHNLSLLAILLYRTGARLGHVRPRDEAELAPRLFIGSLDDLVGAIQAIFIEIISLNVQLGFGATRDQDALDEILELSRRALDVAPHTDRRLLGTEEEERDRYRDVLADGLSDVPAPLETTLAESRSLDESLEELAAEVESFAAEEPEASRPSEGDRGTGESLAEVEPENSGTEIPPADYLPEALPFDVDDGDSSESGSESGRSERALTPAPTRVRQSRPSR